VELLLALGIVAIITVLAYVAFHAVMA